MKNERIVRTCAFCKHACIALEGELRSSVPLISRTEAMQNGESVTLFCRGKKAVMPNHACRRFCFDPLKYRPKPKPQIVTLDEDSLLLD